MLKRKLQSKKGESITEVLVSALVIALGAMMLASMVTSSMRLVQRSDTAYQRYMDEQNMLATRSETSGEAYQLQVKEEAAVKISPAQGITNFGGGEEAVTVYQITEEGANVMAAYEAKQHE